MSPPSRPSHDSSTIEGVRADFPPGLLISLAFWLCLLLSVGLYALVVLSPKIVRCAQRAEEFARLQQSLCDLGRQVDFGDRLTEEWESNADFRASLTRASSADVAADGRLITVEESLRFQGHSRSAPSEVPSQPRQFPMGILRAVAGSRTLQAAALTFAAGLLVAAFTFLPDESARLPSLPRMKAARVRSISKGTHGS